MERRRNAMKKLRYFDLKDKGVEAFKALCTLERKLDEIGLTAKHIDEEDEYFRDKDFITDAVWMDNDGFVGMTFTPQDHVPKFIALGYMRMLLWFAKHGAYDN